jgi:hypothetical protein
MLDNIAWSNCVAVDLHRSVAAVVLNVLCGAVYRPSGVCAQWRD